MRRRNSGLLLLSFVAFSFSSVIRAQTCSPSIQAANQFDSDPVLFTDPTHYTFTANGGASGASLNGIQINPITITADPSCGAWTATANVPWISIVDGASAVGNGFTDYSVAPNADPLPLTGTITFAWNGAPQGAVNLTYTVYELGSQNSALPGPYRIDYRYNAGAGGATDENPFHGADPDGPGPYFLNVAPGFYTVRIVGQGPTPDGAAAWIGNASSGTRYSVSSQFNQGVLNVAVAAGQQIVLYFDDWFDSDNDPNRWTDVTVTLNTTVSITATSGAQQSAIVGFPFAGALQATVLDVNGSPIIGATVIFTAPSSGSGGTFPGNSTVAVAQTGLDGVAAAPSFTANSLAGSYSISATVAGIATPATFNLANVPGPPIAVTAVSGSGQTAIFTTAFAKPLVVMVQDASGNPVPFVEVSFAAPATGPSCSFVTTNLGVVNVLADASGLATSPMFLAGVAPGGPYNVTASVVGVGNSAAFSLTNAPIALFTNPTSLAFVSPNAALPIAQKLLISSPSASVNVFAAATVQTLDGGSWLGVSIVAPGTTPATVLVTANPTGLGVGEYTGKITITSSGVVNPLIVPVSLTVTSTLTIAPSTLVFASAVGGLPTLQSLSISSSLSGQASVSAAVFTPPGGTWLTASLSPHGITAAAATVTANPVGLKAGSYTGSVTISESTLTQTIPVTFTITPPTLAVASACPGNGTEGVPYGPFNLSASGGLGTGSYIFSITNGGLPAGVSLHGNVIGGTPTGSAGTSVFSIQVTSGSQTALTACSVTIAPPVGTLQITGTCPANSILVGSSISISLSATGGKSPYTFRLTSGPAWLALTSQGAGATLAGKPSSAASFPFSVTLTDSVNSKPVIFSCTVVATSSTLKIEANCPAPQTEEVAFSVSLAVNGGQGPYKWHYSGPTWLNLKSATGTSNSLSGTPPQVATSQTFPFTVTLGDSANSVLVTFNCSVTVNPPKLKIAANSSCPTAALVRPASYSNSFSASGGNPPYAWSLAGPSWLTLGAATGPATSIAGGPPADGNYPFTVTLQDNAKTTPATYSCALKVSTPIPPPTVSTGPAPPTLQDPVTGGMLSLATDTPVPLQGEVQLTFTPDAFGATDNPQVQFVFPGQGRTHQFTMPAGSEVQPLPGIQQGTVAGTIHEELVSLLDGTRDVLSGPHPSADFTVPRMAPVITDLALQDQTSSGFTIVIAGYSTPRDMTSVNITFTAAAGGSINGTNQFTIPVNDIFTSFYQSPDSVLGGSAFTNLQIPVTIDGDVSAIGSVGVSLTNPVGTSSVVSKSP